MVVSDEYLNGRPDCFLQVLPLEERFLSSGAVHPLKQRVIAEIVRQAKQVPSVMCIAVFGSSITRRCLPTSDIDLVIWDKEHKFVPVVDDAVDRFFADELNPSYAIYNDIIEKGVIVYDRNDARCC